MFFLLKSFLSFTISFLILSFPVKDNRPLFHYVHQLAAPYTQEIFSDIGNYVYDGGQQAVSFAEKFFVNADPGDVVQAQHPIIVQGASSASSQPAADLHVESVEEYTPEERELLQKILKQGL
ncbi:MAG: hypothetical protein HN353_03165 [Bdellovibrionales bacterium]|jgi:hypothetical protein|nr:hypothetical protein [Bdellovibrionales bacterium]MBT3527093.1 hypothetical protein [Bdellovibrionales bacterium]MBT7669802.1 hypothetical protein [Bdellovibrionales bacterium]MBT7767919.1 hypothetical protein [Bdellovibrionales bacterium]